GVFEGVTTGTPIGLLIENTDQRSRDYGNIKDQFRPAHADYTYHHKYGIRDYRGGGRSSARETAMRVAAGAIAKQYLAAQGLGVCGSSRGLGRVRSDFRPWEAVAASPALCPGPARVRELEGLMDQLRRDQDSMGARTRVVAAGRPAGWGEPVFDRPAAEW